MSSCLAHLSFYSFVSKNIMWLFFKGKANRPACKVSCSAYLWMQTPYIQGMRHAGTSHLTPAQECWIWNHYGGCLQQCKPCRTKVYMSRNDITHIGVSLPLTSSMYYIVCARQLDKTPSTWARYICWLLPPAILWLYLLRNCRQVLCALCTFPIKKTMWTFSTPRTALCTRHCKHKPLVLISCSPRPLFN